MKGLAYAFAAQTFTFLQFQGGLKLGLTEKYPWLLSLGGIPVSYLFMMSVSNFVHGFGGQLWPSRLIGFGVGVIVFTFLSSLLFKEPITLKTLVCLCLASIIVILQVFWKVK
jgi:hypothetical protein